MTDQAAAEVLASVGRARSRGNAEGGGTGTEASEEDDGEDKSQPAKKRARRGKANQDKDESGDGDDEEVISRGGGRGKRASRASGSASVGGRRGSASGHANVQQNAWGDVPLTMQMQLVQHHASEAAGPSMIHDRPGSAFGGGDPRYAVGSGVGGGVGGGGPRGNPFSPNPHGGGFDLPSVNAMLGESTSTSYGAPPSYIRSGSASNLIGTPSRTQSPLAGPGMTTSTGGAPGFVLPPPHSIHGHAHGLSFYMPSGATVGTVGGVPPIPTAPELEKHYMLLAEQKRQLEEMAERTERMMAGVKRGIDELKAAAVGVVVAGAVGAGGASSQGQPSPTQTQPSPTQSPQVPSQPQPQGSASSATASGGGASAVPLRGGDSRQQGAKESVWPVVPPESATRT